MKLIYGYTPEVHKLAEHYIEREILCCDSSLIEDALGLQNEVINDFSKAFSYDNIENLYYISPNWIEDHLTVEQRAALIKANFTSMEDLETFFEDCETDLAEEESTLLADILHEWKHKDSETQEIFEWYRVTNWLYTKLTDLGQPGLSNEYGNWWGRTCTGQSIILDGIFQEIAKLHIR